LPEQEGVVPDHVLFGLLVQIQLQLVEEVPEVWAKRHVEWRCLFEPVVLSVLLPDEGEGGSRAP